VPSPSKAQGRSEAAAAPTLRFSQTRIAFKFVFDCGGGLDPLDAARSILAHDIGIAAVGLGTEDVYVAPRFAKVSRATDLLEELASITEQETKRALVARLVRRPSLLLRIAGSSVRRSGNSEAEQDAVAPREAEPESDGGPTASDWATSIREDAAALRWTITEAPIVQQVAISYDRQRFQPDYLSSLPFCRIQLQPITCATAEGESILYEADLVIHRGGIAILTFWWHDDDRRRDVDSLIPLTLGSTGRFTKIRISEAAARTAGWPEVETIPGSSREFEGGIWWRTDDHRQPEPWSLIAHVYMEAISKSLSRAGSRSSSWLCYPVIFTSLESAASRLRSQHGRLQLAGLIARMFSWRELTPEAAEKLIGRDWSLHADSSIYFDAANFVVLRHGRDQGLTHRDLDWAGTVDHLLIRAWLPRVANDMLLAAAATPSAVREVAGHLLLASRELAGSGVVSWGSLRDMVSASDRSLGVAGDVAAAQERLRLLSQVTEAAEAEHRARRDTVLQLVAALAAVMLGLPALNEAVSIVTSGGLPSWLGSWVQGSVKGARGREAQVSVSIWLGFVVCMGGTLCWGLWRRRPRAPFAESAAARFSGRWPYRWPDGPIKVDLDSPYHGALDVEPEDEAQGAQQPAGD
jgi:hypothetical protein